MKLYDGKGNSTNVKVGLVDRTGAFFVLLEDHTTHQRYLRFSTEAEALEKALNQVDSLEAKCANLEEKLENAKPENKAKIALDKYGTTNVVGAARLLGVGELKVKQLVANGELRTMLNRKTGPIRVFVDSILEYATECNTGRDLL